MAKKVGSAATPAIAALRDAGLPHTVHQFTHDPGEQAFGVEAVNALGAAPERVFKTLVIADGSALAIAVVPVSGTLNLKAAGAALGLHRPTMADPADVRRVTGYVLGGVAPLGSRKPLPTAVDESALAFDTVFCSAGRRGLELELAPADLISAAGAVTAPIGSGKKTLSNPAANQ